MIVGFGTWITKVGDGKSPVSRNSVFIWVLRWGVLRSWKKDSYTLRIR